MFQSPKARPPRSNQSRTRTESRRHASFYEVLTHSSSLEYRVSQAAQAKLQINPIYKLNIVRKLKRDGAELLDKRQKVLYFRRKEKRQDQDQMLCFFKNPPAASANAFKSNPAEINLAFREKMKKHAKSQRTRSIQEIENEPCFTGFSALLHRRARYCHQSSRDLSSSHPSRPCPAAQSARQQPVQLSRSPYRERYRNGRGKAYRTERSGDVLSPWEAEEERRLPH